MGIDLIKHLCTLKWNDEFPVRLVNDYYSRNQKMLASVYRDVTGVKPLTAIMNGFDAYVAGLADHLTDRLAKGRNNEPLKAVARHLVRFSTWQSLAREKLSNEEMARVGWLWLKRLSG